MREEKIGIFGKLQFNTYLLTPCSRVLLEKLTGLQLVKKFPAFYGTRKFITAITSARHLSLSWVSSIQPITLHPTSWRSILILSSHLRLGLPSGLFPPGFPTKTLYTPLPSPMRATCPAPLILLDFITRTILGEEYRISSSSLCIFLHSPVTSSILGPNILLNTLFSNTLSLHSCLNVSDQVSHPYKTISKNIVLYILIFKFLDSKLSSLHQCYKLFRVLPGGWTLGQWEWREKYFRPTPRIRKWIFLNEGQPAFFFFSFCPAFVFEMITN